MEALLKRLEEELKNKQGWCEPEEYDRNATEISTLEDVISMVKDELQKLNCIKCVYAIFPLPKICSNCSVGKTNFYKTK